MRLKEAAEVFAAMFAASDDQQQDLRDAFIAGVAAGQAFMEDALNDETEELSDNLLEEIEQLTEEMLDRRGIDIADVVVQ